MMMDKVLFSSNSSDWRTPKWLFSALNKMFRFTADVDYANPIIDGWPSGFDALANSWPSGGRYFINPPYGKNAGKIDKWLARGYEASINGSLVVFLLPARTSTIWFHKFAPLGMVYFIKGRLKFESDSGSKYSAPFPSMLLVFGLGHGVNYVSIESLMHVFAD